MKHESLRLQSLTTSLENTEAGVKAIAIHPGAVPTDLSAAVIAKGPELAAMFIDPPELEAWTQGMYTTQNV